MAPMEGKRKEKVTKKKGKREFRKLLPRKSIRGVKVSTSPKIPIAEKESDDQNKPKPTGKE